MKNRIRISLLLLASLSAALRGATYYVATNGVNGNSGTSAAPFATFAKAFGAMSAGDTLLIKDGTYSERMIDMPSGTDGHYIHIKAEHNFRVTVRVGGALFVNGKSYVRMEGIKYDGNLANGDCAIVASSHHIKIIRCSFTGSMPSSVNWNIVTFGLTSDCSYILIEECWAWGTGRYKFLSYTSNHVIFRRCVARHDYHPTQQCACFHRYSSTNVEFQNCIALDCGLADESNGKFYGGIFNDNHDPAVDNSGKNLGCIVLNLGAGVPIYDIRIWGTRTIENCAVWDCYNGIDLSNYKDGITPFSPASAYVNHCTVGDLWGTDWAGGYGIFDEMATMETTSVKNSIVTKTTQAFNTIKTIDSNCLYGNTTNYSNTPAGPYDNTNNSGLLYITRAPAGAGNASDSSYRGATIEKRYGVDESLWGEAGYETLTNVNLWPWPNEAEIKADMSSWDKQLSEGSYTSVGVLGTRGFCANGNGLNGKPLTLTSYIWEYLGNPCPPEIYGSVKTKISAAPVEKISLKCSSNPFNSAAAIAYHIQTQNYAFLHLSIYSASGKCVATLANGPQAPGMHTVTWNAAGYPSGVYLARLRIGSEVQQQKLILAR